MELIEILSKKINKNAVVTEISKDRDPFKVLISTIISARTKDEVTEEVSKRLFNVVKNVDDLLKIDEEELSKLIYPAGFYKNKAKNLKKLAIILKENYNGKVPDSLEDLLKLPGVGRKTANLVITLAFDKDGICVDTHVHRICNRWGIVDTETPEETEFELRKKLPKKYWKIINNLLVVFGREICSPKPKCDKCFEEIRLKCPYYKKIKVFENILKKFDFKKVSKNKIPNEKGTYILKIKLKEGKKIKFGKKEEFFKKGIYFYVGSAYGNSINLKNRIERHLKDDKKMHWHIDYLLKYGKVEEIFITNKRVECEVANEFIKEFDYIERFGCSDCNCKSHLFYMKP
ncbi:DUF123 domain-containing protein [Methanocaldococcus sp.]|uniref:DUF123 domain-containing protein n=1 Tax=Methanocaldococcus sp. TaxID=2152917 RepID=UPI00262C9EFA|nr:DUF123 domain-containing protein [Methanocaldococcus sp.]MCQ6254682.1 DUF123 domain-containing protein [Methanocaldococcus sp.]